MLGSDEGTAREVLAWMGVKIMVVGWMFGGVGCHATRNITELSYELDYAISFWL